MTSSKIDDPLMDEIGGLWRASTGLDARASHSDEERSLEALLERRQKRNTVRFWATALAEALVIVLGLLHATRLIMANGAGTADGRTQGIALAVLLTMTAVLSVISRRGQWRAVDSSPGEAAALEVRRARGRQLGCRIGWVVLVAVVGFIFWSLRSVGVELLSLRFAVLLVVSVGYVVVLLVLGRRARQELKQSRELLEQLTR